MSRMKHKGSGGHAGTAALLWACLLAAILLCVGCRGAEARYLDEVQEGLVSFSDCADAFTDSLRAIGEQQTVPPSGQLDHIEQRLDALSAVCHRLASLEAPTSCADRQAALRTAMTQYEDALEKCRVILTFYRDYDEKFHTFNDPEEGSKQMEAELTALYADFTDAMWTAEDSFHAAREAFS